MVSSVADIMRETGTCITGHPARWRDVSGSASICTMALYTQVITHTMNMITTGQYAPSRDAQTPAAICTMGTHTVDIPIRTAIIITGARAAQLDARAPDTTYMVLRHTADTTRLPHRLERQVAQRGLLFRVPAITAYTTAVTATIDWQK